jgi:hypothetical protein
MILILEQVPTDGVGEKVLVLKPIDINTLAYNLEFHGRSLLRESS